jgi:hypothetical protein
MIRHRQRCARKGGSAEIPPCELMAMWIYDEKFLTDMRFLFRTLSFTVGKDDDLERPAQEQEERRTTTIGFKFHQGLKKSTTTIQAIVRQPVTINLIDGPARPLIGTSSTTTRSFGLALSET